MTVLQRVTTQYVDSQDRIRLSGEQGDDRRIVLWLTQRLLHRVVPHLCGWLEKQGTLGAPVEVVQGFAQQAALSALQAQPQPPVAVERTTQAWLLTQIDISPGTKGLTLHFKADGQAASVAQLHLAPQPLRQWVGILCQQARSAGWSLDQWPDWVRESRAPEPAQAVAVLH